MSIYRECLDAMDFDITRQKDKYTNCRHEMLEDNIGYIQILEFDEITITQFDDTLNAMEKQGMEGLIIDVRIAQEAY